MSLQSQTASWKMAAHMAVFWFCECLFCAIYINSSFLILSLSRKKRTKFVASVFYFKMGSEVCFTSCCHVWLFCSKKLQSWCQWVSQQPQNFTRSAQRLYRSQQAPRNWTSCYKVSRLMIKLNSVSWPLVMWLTGGMGILFSFLFQVKFVFVNKLCTYTYRSNGCLGEDLKTNLGLLVCK